MAFDEQPRPFEAPGPLVAWLSSPGAYPDSPATVEIAETHISWVFLTPRFVYKLKKPVCFDFLDFSTAEKRKAACNEELRLNRRMAPGVYLDVLPVRTAAGGGLSLEGAGDPVDWLVHMRRLPANRMLDELLRGNTLAASDLDRLAETLARYYRQAPAVAQSPQAYRSAYEGRVLATARELADSRHGLDPVQIERVNSSQQRYLWLAADRLLARAAAGRVIEGHGDLRPEHVCLIEPPVVFDCIEFNAAFRHIDVADELSFLAMECERLARPDVGQAIFERYSRASNDLAPPELLSFYKAYRASVRCKVAALRAAEHAGAQRTADRREAEEYLKLADGYVAQLPKPPLVIVRGISGSGKSTLAALLAQRLGARVLRTDEVRRQVSDGLDARARYRPENRAAVYDELFARAESLLRQGLMVLLDGTFLERRQRRLAAETAERCGVGCVQLHCVVSAETAQARIAERRAAGSDASEATPELVQRQLEANEADDARTPPVVEIDASGDREAACLQTIAAIAQAMGEL